MILVKIGAPGLPWRLQGTLLGVSGGFVFDFDGFWVTLDDIWEPFLCISVICPQVMVRRERLGC